MMEASSHPSPALTSRVRVYILRPVRMTEMERKVPPTPRMVGPSSPSMQGMDNMGEDMFALCGSIVDTKNV